MPDYKMVFSDIDGTLLNSKGEITPKTAEAIKKLEQSGVPFVLVSSRPPFGLDYLHKELELQSPTICFGGAAVMENEKMLHQACLGGKEALYVIDLAAKKWPGLCCTVSTFDQWIVDDLQNPWVVLENEVTGIVPTQGNVKELLMSEEPVYKMLCMGEPEEIDALKKTLEQEKKVTAACSKPIYLEITAYGVSKASAIDFLCERCDVSVPETISFGDNFNDVKMLEATGLSFAMGNAPQEIKQIADRVTADHDNDGIAQALEEIFGC